MNKITDLLGRKYADLRDSSIFGPNMPEAESIGDQCYVSLPSRGISLVLPDKENVGVVQLHAAGHEGFLQFDGSVPIDIAFGMTRAEVRRRLGKPVLCGEIQSIPVLGVKPAWDSYEFDGVRVHIEYTLHREMVQLISLVLA